MGFLMKLTACWIWAFLASSIKLLLKLAGVNRICCSRPRWKALACVILPMICSMNLQSSKPIHRVVRKPKITSGVVFVKTRERLQWLRENLQRLGVNVCYLQGEMPQDKRNAALASFKSGKLNILLATDVAARGIDVPNVSHVINFDMPRKADVYVHRIGRTGRAGAKGTAISLIEAHDFEMVGKVSRYMDEPFKARFVEGLRPKHKAPENKAKKKKSKTTK